MFLRLRKGTPKSKQTADIDSGLLCKLNCRYLYKCHKIFATIYSRLYVNDIFFKSIYYSVTFIRLSRFSVKFEWTKMHLNNDHFSLAYNRMVNRWLTVSWAFIYENFRYARDAH